MEHLSFDMRDSTQTCSRIISYFETEILSTIGDRSFKSKNLFDRVYWVHDGIRLTMIFSFSMVKCENNDRANDV